MFRTLNSTTPHSDDGSFFIYLGTKDAASVKRKLAFTVVTEEVFLAIKELPLHALVDGITVVINPANYARNKHWTDAIQKYLAMAYCKYVLFPRQSATIPDLVGVRKEEQHLLIPREIQKAENIPRYLQSPLCDKLKGLGKNIPVAILLPGPSLNKSIHILKELQEKCLIVCVPRTLEFCIQADVEPDFVISLDTAARMQHLVTPSRHLSKTFLVALSPGALTKPLERYRGLFLMESFDTAILPNKYRLRESWLSCSISTLGIAELLESKTVFLLGGDHSWEDGSATAGCYWNAKPSPELLRGYFGTKIEWKQISWREAVERNTPWVYPQSNKYSGPAQVKDLSEQIPAGLPDEAIMRTDGKDTPLPGMPDRYSPFTLADRNGTAVRTYFHYYAISAELEMVAQEMADKHGTTCYLLEDSGILSAQYFKRDGAKVLKALPPLARKAFILAADAAHAKKERINYALYAKSLGNLADTIAKHAAYLTFCLHDNQLEEAIQHPYVQAIDTASAQRKLSAVRDYRMRAKYDGNFAFYEYQLERLVKDSEAFPMLKKEFYTQRISQCQATILRENFDQKRSSLFPEDDRHVVETTIRSCETWLARLNEGIALSRVYQAASSHDTIVIWCLPEEKVVLFKKLSHQLKRFVPHFATISLQEQLASTRRTLEYVYIDDFLLFANTCKHAQIVSNNFQNKYSYLINMIDKKNFVQENMVTEIIPHYL